MAVTSIVPNADGTKEMGALLRSVRRCPHCAVATPNLGQVWASRGQTRNKEGREGGYWAAYLCESCAGIVIAEGAPERQVFTVIAMYPEERSAHEDIPAIARTFLQQAMDTLHAPDAAAVMAGSAVDAMLKAHGFEDGSLYKRIDDALEANLLTKGMADWAHEVRLGSNRPRHADAEKPHVSPDEAKQSVEFAEALGSFLFVLTARIERGTVAAKEAK